MKMKLLFLFIALIVALSVRSQSGNGDKGNFNLVETTVPKINVFSQENKMIAHIICLKGPLIQMYLINGRQWKAENGKYLTEFKFTYPDSVQSHEIMLILDFDKEVDTVSYSIENGAVDIYRKMGMYKRSSFLSIGKLPYQGIITATVVSNKKVFTAITGVKGKLEN